MLPSEHVEFNICLYAGLFLWRYGIPAPFFQSKEKQLFVMYIIKKYVISSYLVPAPVT